MTGTIPSTARTTWTETGEQLFDRDRATREGHAYAAGCEAVAAGIEALSWHEVDDARAVPVSPGEAINHLVRELRLPRVSRVSRVSRVAWDDGVEVFSDAEGSHAAYGLYGIEANYTNGRVRVFVVDRGADLLVVATEHTPSAAAQASDAAQEG